MYKAYVWLQYFLISNPEPWWHDKLKKQCIRNDSVHFSSVAQSCLTLCDPMNRSTPGLPVHHQLAEFTQTHVHWVGDAIQSYYPLSFPSPSALSLFQHQGLCKWVSSLYQAAKVLEFQLQHQSFQWTPRVIFQLSHPYMTIGKRHVTKSKQHIWVLVKQHLCMEKCSDLMHMKYF